MTDPRYLSAKEAAEELDISLPTLYAYVSRGLIRSEPTGDKKRTRRYRAEDVQTLKARKEQRRNPAKAVEEALHWGTPVLESALTLISDNHLYYRGYDVLALADQYSVEQVAVLLWTGELPDGEPDAEPALFAGVTGRLPERCRARQPQVADLPPMAAFQALLPLAAAGDLAAYDLRPATVMQTGAHILRLLTAIAVQAESAAGGVARTLQQGWVAADPGAAAVLSTALILCADHELNVSSFTARCVASAGARPYEVVLAGLAALQGVKHGRATDRVEAFFREVGDPARVQTAIAHRLRRGERIPGFGHPLYPGGDPRGRALLDLAAQQYPAAPAVALARAIVAEVAAVTGERPSLDVGLVALTQAMALPPESAIAIFALGRVIGWIGHALEQYAADRMIRPRARYVGQPPRHGAH